MNLPVLNQIVYYRNSYALPVGNNWNERFWVSGQTDRQFMFLTYYHLLREVSIIINIITVLWLNGYDNWNSVVGSEASSFYLPKNDGADWEFFSTSSKDTDGPDPPPKPPPRPPPPKEPPPNDCGCFGGAWACGAGAGAGGLAGASPKDSLGIER